MGATWSSFDDEESGLVGVMAPSPVAVPGDEDLPYPPVHSVVTRARPAFVASPALRLALSNYTGSCTEMSASSQPSSMHTQACAEHVHCVCMPVHGLCMACYRGHTEEFA